MERKPVEDEDSFGGEEFLEENDFDEEVVIEKASPKDKSKDKKKTKDKKTIAEKKEMQDEEEGWIEIKEPEEKKEEMKKEELIAAKAEPIAVASPSDPWKPEAPPEASSDGTVWKVMTGILVVLLIASVFTYGFRFGNNGLTGGSVITLAQAEDKALSYVNTNLLQPPFVATVEKSEDAGNLYKVTLAVAGQNIDSYITKDGKLFFPQGFDTTLSLQDQRAQEKGSELPEEKTTEIEIPEESAETVPPEETTPPESAEPQTEFTITAKKWLFTPNKITVPFREEITFTIEPKDIEFTFSLPAFNIKKEVKDTTIVTFTADKKGTFPFLCSSCEEFRGMSGTLVVE